MMLVKRFRKSASPLSRRRSGGAAGAPAGGIKSTASRKRIYVDWVIAGLTRPGRTKTGLAMALDIEPSSITRMVKGNRDIKAHEIEVIAHYLGVPAPNSTLSMECPSCVQRRGHSIAPLVSKRS